MTDRQTHTQTNNTHRYFGLSRGCAGPHPFTLTLHQLQLVLTEVESIREVAENMEPELLGSGPGDWVRGPCSPSSCAGIGRRRSLGPIWGAIHLFAACCRRKRMLHHWRLGESLKRHHYGILQHCMMRLSNSGRGEGTQRWPSSDSD